MHRAVVLLSARVSPAASLGTGLSSCGVWTISTSHRSSPQCCHFATPEFRYDASGIWTIFRFEYPDRAVNTEPNHKRPENDQKATRKRPETDQKEWESAILELIKEQPYISRKEMARCLGLHDSSIKRRLASLQERGIIKRIGPDRGGHWEMLVSEPK